MAEARADPGDGGRVGLHCAVSMDCAGRAGIPRKGLRAEEQMLTWEDKLCKGGGSCIGHMSKLPVYIGSESKYWTESVDGGQVDPRFRLLERMGGD